MNKNKNNFGVMQGRAHSFLLLVYWWSSGLVIQTTLVRISLATISDETGSSFSNR